MEAKAARRAYVRIEHITPEKASQLLQFNTHNRDLRVARVKAISGAIVRGEWCLGPDCISLSGNGDGGVLLNGQHRLYAIIDAGIGVDVAVMYNVAPEAQETMDSGMPRQLSAKLKLRGEKYYTELPGALRLVWSYDRDELPDPRFTTQRPSDQQLIACLDANPALRETPPIAVALRKEFLSPGFSWAGWVFLFTREAGTDHAEAFVEKLVSGAELPERSPVFVLRQLLLKQRHLPGDRRFGGVLMAAMIVKAFNAFCLGQEVRILKWDGREQFPRIVRKEELL